MIVPIYGPARGTSTPGAFKPRRAFSMPVSSFPRPHSSWHDRAESATPDGSDPTLSNNWVPAERRIQSISVGWIIGLWRAAFGVATERWSNRAFRVMGVALWAGFFRADARRGRGLLSRSIPERRIPPDIDRARPCEGGIPARRRTGPTGR